VLSLPFELRALAAFRADVLSALVRIFLEAVFARYRAWAKRERLGDAPTGAVTHIQRFGSSINLNVHAHSMLLDGVFTRDEKGRLRFHAAPPPTREELGEVVRRAHRRVLAWLARKNRLGAPPVEDGSQEMRAQTSLEACATIAMGRGAVRALRDDADAEGESVPAAPAPPRDESAVEHQGFNLHASVAIAADDDVGREILMRYGARPPLALDRLRRLPGGRIAYHIKKLRGGRAKSRVMTPLEFLARLSSIVPPPRYPLLRYHGVLGPRSPWRRDVVPRAPASKPCDRAREAAKPSESPSAPKPAAKPPSGASESRSGSTSERTASVAAPRPAFETRSLEPSVLCTESGTSPSSVLLAPNILSVKHWDRLLGGALYAATRRVDWASLLRRSFDVDVLQCVSCGGRLRVVGEVTEPAMVRLVLESLGMPAEGPRIARARDPTELLGEEAEA
jgi:hypothetical protein